MDGEQRRGHRRNCRERKGGERVEEGEGRFLSEVISDGTLTTLPGKGLTRVMQEIAEWSSS